MYISDKQKFTLLCQVGGSHVYVLDKQKFTLPCQVGEAMFLSVKQKFTLLCQMSGTVSQEPFTIRQHFFCFTCWNHVDEVMHQITKLYFVYA